MHFAFAPAHLHRLDSQLQAAGGAAIDVAAHTAVIALVTSGVVAFDNGDYPRGLALVGRRRRAI